jgi:DNA-binding response OmpR family regulator
MPEFPKRSVVYASQMSANLGVELLHWPRDAKLRAVLARASIARLLMVEAGIDPPDDLGIDEDWVRLPADERELATRAERLRRISTKLDTETPLLDDNRVLHRGGPTVVLSRSEATLVRILLESTGTIVPRETLVRALWPDDDAPGPRAVDAIVYRLRRRLAGMHLCIRSARSRGFVIFLDQAE